VAEERGIAWGTEPNVLITENGSLCWWCL